MLVFGRISTAATSLDYSDFSFAFLTPESGFLGFARRRLTGVCSSLLLATFKIGSSSFYRVNAASIVPVIVNV